MFILFCVRSNQGKIVAIAFRASCGAGRSVPGDGSRPHDIASALPPRHEGEAFEEMHVLFVLEQGAVQFRQGVRAVAA